MDFVEFPSGTGRVRWGLRVFWLIFRGVGNACAIFVGFPY